MFGYLNLLANCIDNFTHGLAVAGSFVVSNQVCPMLPFHKIHTYVHTMPTKSLGTLAMIYAIVELQNPLPHKTMLCKGAMNISASRSDTFLQR